ncbi:MAG: hypothetical protein U0441_23845 [Polyangiaceae bacterium]
MRTGCLLSTLRGGLFAAALCGAVGVLGGCAGELVASYPVVEADVVPVEITTYPHVYYAGSDAYLVDGRWYYRSRGRWVVFRREPAELQTYRVDYYRRRPGGTYQAPPAHRRRVPGGTYEAPDAHRRRNEP